MISDENAFVLNDGTKIKGLRELASVLSEMNEELFVHHVNGEKNDFAEWIGNVFGNVALAERVRGISNPTIISSIIRIYLSRKALEREYRK